MNPFTPAGTTWPNESQLKFLFLRGGADSFKIRAHLSLDISKVLTSSVNVVLSLKSNETCYLFVKSSLSPVVDGLRHFNNKI